MLRMIIEIDEEKWARSMALPPAVFDSEGFVEELALAFCGSVLRGHKEVAKNIDPLDNGITVTIERGDKRFTLKAADISQ